VVAIVWQTKKVLSENLLDRICNKEIHFWGNIKSPHCGFENSPMATIVCDVVWGVVLA